jgi:large subunit ribosomal protein L35
MPKIKSHRGTVKRVKRSASGKLMRRRAYHSHILSKKSRKRKRHLRAIATVSSADHRTIGQMLGKNG